MDGKLKIAGLQMEPRILDKQGNLARCLELMEHSAAQGARLMVFPECALTGNCYSSLHEAIPMAEPIPGPSTDRLAAACRELDVYVVIGLIEDGGDRLYNAAALLGPAGLLGKHRKLHLPYLGVDRFLSWGDAPPAVYQTELGRIGIGICYDLMFAEHSRILSLQGADLLVFPANWPELGRVYSDYIVPTRAIENHVFCLAVNRVGDERGTRFCGGSSIADWLGRTLARAKDDEEDIIYAEIEPEEARRKHMVIEPGQHEVDFINDRRPDLYGLICRE